MDRRRFLGSCAATGVALGLPGKTRADLAASPRLTLPPLLDTTETKRLRLTAQPGNTRFLPGGRATPTSGYNGAYLGSTVRMRNGALDSELGNSLAEPVSYHWHGMLIRGEHDGGPHSAIAPADTWRAEMQIAQSPATLWYHSHIHGRTGPHVYWGLAGVVQITDGRDDARGLPGAYGIDDLTLIIQDRRFDDAGRMVYAPSMTDILNGFHGDRILVNGQSGAVAAVPEAFVRLRLLNASNARIYTLSFSDRRPMHLVATDNGYVARPAALTFLRLAPGERAEVLVDFSTGGEATLISSRGLPLTVMRFAADARLPARIDRPPETLDEDPDDLGPPMRTRRFALNMGGGSDATAAHAHIHGEGMVGSGAHDFGINGHPMDLHRIDEKVPIGTVERWIIGGGGAIEHPFHVHGVRFRIRGEAGGTKPSVQNRGWKDVVLVNGETEIAVRFDHSAPAAFPYMYHCHILEHEDSGMMGQFTVG